MKIINYIGFVIALTALLIITSLAHIIALKIPFFKDPTFFVGLLQLGLPLVILIGVIFIAGTYQDIKHNTRNIVLLSVLSITMTVFLVDWINNTASFNELKINYNTERLTYFDKRTPNSDDVIELRNLIKDKNYDEAEKFEVERLYYVDQLEASLLANKYPTPEIKNVFQKALNDGYINIKETTDVKLAIKDYLINKMRTN